MNILHNISCASLRFIIFSLLDFEWKETFAQTYIHKHTHTNSHTDTRNILQGLCILILNRRFIEQSIFEETFYIFYSRQGGYLILKRIFMMNNRVMSWGWYTPPEFSNIIIDRWEDHLKNKRIQFIFLYVYSNWKRKFSYFMAFLFV